MEPLSNRSDRDSNLPEYYQVGGEARLAVLWRSNHTANFLHRQQPFIQPEHAFLQSEQSFI